MPSAKDNKTSREWWREVFSEKGIGSVKRVVGTFISVVSMGCIVYLTITAGPVMIVENLLQTSLITGAALLGLHSITSIWKNGSMSVGGDGKDITYKGDDSKKVLEDVLARQDENKNGISDDEES
jgi:hypothetical protein